MCLQGLLIAGVAWNTVNFTLGKLIPVSVTLPESLFYSLCVRVNSGSLFTSSAIHVFITLGLKIEQSGTFHRYYLVLRQGLTVALAGLELTQVHAPPHVPKDFHFIQEQ